MILASYVSASSFRVSGDKTAKYRKGQRVTCYMTTSSLEATIVSSAIDVNNTLVTVVCDSGGSLTSTLYRVTLGDTYSDNDNSSGNVTEHDHKTPWGGKYIPAASLSEAEKDNLQTIDIPADGDAGKLLAVSPAFADGYQLKTLAGTTNRLTVTIADGLITLTIPQDFHTGASIQLAQLLLSSLLVGTERATPGDNAPTGTRRLYPKTTGWVEQDDAGTETAFSMDGHSHSDFVEHAADVAIHQAHGFVDRAESTLSFTPGTLTFAITPTGTNFDIYISGEKFTKTAGSVVIPNTPDLYFIYYDSEGVLTAATSVWNFMTDVMVATLYWNGTSGFIGEDRHEYRMDPKTHEYLHETVGSRYADGLAGTFTNTTIQIEAGEWYDEDIEWITTQQTTVPVFYKNGSAVWNWTSAQAKPYYEASDVLQYNNSNALADVDNNKYVAYWTYAINNATTPIVSIMGQRQDNTLALARENNVPSALSFGDLPVLEMKLLYRVIYQRSGTSEIYVEAQDYRNVVPLPTGSYVATDHGTLSGLNDSDHPASAIYTDTTDFDGLLSSEDDNVQDALDSIDSKLKKSIATLTDAATVTPDFAASNNFTITLGGDRTFVNPTNASPGYDGIIYFVQGTGGNHEPTFEYAYRFVETPVWSTTEGAVDAIKYWVRSSDNIVCEFLKGIGLTS